MENIVKTFHNTSLEQCCNNVYLLHKTCVKCNRLLMLFFYILLNIPIASLFGECKVTVLFVCIRILSRQLFIVIILDLH